MSASAGEIGLDLVLNSNGFSNSMSGIESMAKKAATALAAAFSVQKIISFASECIELGSDLAEVQNVVDVTFSTMSESVNAWAKSAAESFGLSETMAKQYVGTFGSMAEAFGFTEAEAYDMSTALTGLVGDVSSFYNLDQDTAYTKLKAVFSGETESLKDLGIVMTQTALDSYALANGFGKTTSEMTEAEKVTLRMAFVTDQLSNAAGDFERTSDSWANQTKVLSLQMDSLKASIGQGLINALTPALKMLNSLIAKLEEAAAVFEAFTEEIFGFSSTDSGTSAAADDLDSAADSASSVTDSLEEASRYLAGFDVMTKASSTNETSSTSAAASSLSSTGTSSSATLSVGVETDVDLSGMQDIKDMLDNFQMQINNFVENLPALEFDCDWEIVKDNLIQSAENALGTVLNIGSTIITIGIEFLNDIDLDDLIEGFSGLLESATACAEAFTGTVGPAFESFYETGISPIVEWIGDKLAEAIEKVSGYFDDWTVWWDENEEGITDLATKIGDVVAEVWNLIEPLLDEAWDTFWDIMDKINTLVQDFCQWLIDNSDYTVAALVGITTALVAYKAATMISSIVSTLTKAIEGQTLATTLATAAQKLFNLAMTPVPLTIIVAAIAGLVAAFVYLWNNCEEFRQFWIDLWDAIKWTFEQVVDGIKSGINSVIGFINGLISGFVDGINGIINGINSISIDVPDWLQDLTGMSSIGFSIPTVTAPQIPQLAEGGYVEANTPQLAVIGDNKTQGEVVAPEDKLQAMANAAAGGSAEVLNKILNISEQVLAAVQDGADIVLMVDSEELARATSNGSMALKRRYVTTAVSMN